MTHTPDTARQHMLLPRPSRGRGTTRRGVEGATFKRRSSGSAPSTAPRSPSPEAARRVRMGFTLVEMMVTIVIIGLLATVVVINVLPSQDKAMVGKARADLATLENALEQYRLDMLTFPTTGEGLSALTAVPSGSPRADRYRTGGYIRRLPEDPWGNAYQYRRESEHGQTFDVFSYGADGKPGGEGNDADIGNWQG